MKSTARTDTSPAKPATIRVSQTRRRVVFAGRVQGVGFRAAAHAMAAGRPLTGFVRNAADGTVELEAQGDAREIDGLMTALGERFRGQIDSADTCEVPRVDGESGFVIRR